MKKIISKIKKIFLMLGTFILALYTKVIASSPVLPSDLSELNIVAMYGVVSPERRIISIILKILKGFIFPIAFIIGVIIYFKKSSSSTLKKIITVIVALAVIIFVYLLISKIFNIISYL